MGNFIIPTFRKNLNFGDKMKIYTYEQENGNKYLLEETGRVEKLKEMPIQRKIYKIIKYYKNSTLYPKDELYLFPEDEKLLKREIK